MPGDNHSEISYRVKCVLVESERVFGDIVVTQQNRDRLYCVDALNYPSLARPKVCNLTKQILETPDFMALNRKPKNRKIQRVPKILPITKDSQSAKKNGSVSNERIIANTGRHVELKRRQKSYPLPMLRESVSQEDVVTSLVDQLLLDIYGYPRSERGRSESDSTASSYKPPPQHRYLRRARLLRKSKEELSVVLDTLEEHVNHAGGLLVRQLRRRDYLTAKRDKQYDVITAYLQAYSAKRSEDTRMRFSLTPQPGESGFTQWLDAMKMVARLQGGIPQEFRKRLWLTLAERHLDQRGVDWKQAEKLCFNEWSNPDDEELGIQIVKDLHRTGCSLFCGAAGRDNQAVLRRVLLGFARWNKSVGYCQGLNVLAALVLQVTDRAESSAVKVMIYLIEGVLPEGYFADNLRGLSIDMAVFRDLLRMRLPKLSRHLEALQTDAKDKATGSSYEPPLTNVFTMQWFLTLFCHCLPQEAVLRVWDLIFLEGDEVLLRTALAIWEGISDRIMTVTSADEFYSIMGVLTREMLEFTDVNNLIKTIVNMGPLYGVTDLREKHRYNITPWARRLSDEEDTDTEDEERLAVAAAMFGVPQRFKKDRSNASSSALQTIGPTSDRERLALDISTLKHQYAKLRERQRQAHIILSAACARQSMVPSSTSQAMNHLLVGKSALVSAKTRQLGPPPGAIPPKPRTTSTLHTTRVQTGRRDKQGVTLHWKDTKKPKEEPAAGDEAEASPSVVDPPEVMSVTLTSPKRASSNDSDSDSTSTELCDEPDRLSDVDSEEPTSTSDCYVMATDDEKSPRPGASPITGNTPVRQSSEQSSTGKRDTLDVEGYKHDNTINSRHLLDVEDASSSIAKITDQIRRLSASDDNNSSSISQVESVIEKKNETENYVDEDSDKIVPKKETFSKVGTNIEVHFSVSSVTPEIEEVSRTNSHGVKESFEMLDRYDFLSGSDKPGIVDKSIAPTILLVKEHCETIGEKVSIAGTNDSASSVDVTSDSRTNEFTAVAESTLVSAVGKDDNADILRFEPNSKVAESYEKDKPVSTDLVICDSSKYQRDSSGTIIPPAGDQFETIAGERTFYSRSYVIGHLPISPATVNEKLSRAAEISPIRNNVRILSKDVGNIEAGIGKNVDTSFPSVMKMGTESKSANFSSVFTSNLSTNNELDMLSYEVHKSVESNLSSGTLVNRDGLIPGSSTLVDNIGKTSESVGHTDYSVDKNSTGSLNPGLKIVSSGHLDNSLIGNARNLIDKVGGLNYDVRREKTGNLTDDPQVLRPDHPDNSLIGNSRNLIDKVESLDYTVREEKPRSLVGDPKIGSPNHLDNSLISNARNLIDKVESLDYAVSKGEVETSVTDPTIAGPVYSDVSVIGNTRNPIDEAGILDYDVSKRKVESLVTDSRIVGPPYSDIATIGNTQDPIVKLEGLDYGIGRETAGNFLTDPKIVNPVHSDISMIGSARKPIDKVDTMNYSIGKGTAGSLLTDPRIVNPDHSDNSLIGNARNSIDNVGSLDYDLTTKIDKTSSGSSTLPLNDKKVSSNNEEKLATSLSLSIDKTSTSKLSSNYVHNDFLSTKIYEDKKTSPKTPDSAKSFSSGETMGPDSKNSSLTTSPKSLTNRSDSRNFPQDKSERSSLSSDSKTLTLRSLGSESAAANDKTKLDTKSEVTRPSLDISSPSTPISTDSLKNKSEISPKFVISSSSESCSPGKTTKSSERSFSSDLQSPISANSIKYRTNYTEGQDNLSESPMDICSATSPFYPIANPNQKTPSPYGTTGKQRTNSESVETSPEQKSTSSKDETSSIKHNVDTDSLGVTRSNEVVKSLRDKDDYDSGRPFEKELAETLSSLPHERPKTEARTSNYKEDLELASYRSKKTTIKEKVAEEIEERYMETDTVSPLPSDKYEANRSAFVDKCGSYKGFTTKERDHKYLLSTRESFKPFERSCSSLEKRFADVSESPSSDELYVNTHKKRSSDILEDLKHLEAKTSKDGETDTSMLTRKTGYVWEDLKNLEARRQDNFSDSASEFTRERLDPPRINVFSEPRKSYVVEPKINLEAGTDSILKSYARKKSNGEPDDDRESKLGVWTKVKPRAGRDNGRRSSDRALKIIQENSAILHKILTCQAKKRLPDLEEISKEITISPINEEISKIFSPILEKMGLNEHEINEELARINFKDFDQMTTTSGSEFDAKMNDELSKLSLIDDNEIVDHMDIDDVISRNYLDTREALIDRQINEELSKLLANYEGASPICTVGNRDEASSSCQNQSEIEPLDISSISTNVFSYQSSNESIETKSELDLIQDPTIHASETFSQYSDDSMMKFAKSPKYSLRGMSPRSDIDIYRELEKLDKISSGEILPSSSSVIAQKIISPMSYGTECPIYTEVRPSSLEYCAKPEKSFDRSPMKSPYDTYKPYDFKSRISPRKTPSNPYSARSYDKAGMDANFDFHDDSTSPTSLYDLVPSRPILSKETLEFRVRYDDDASKVIRDDNLSLEPYQTSLVNLDRGASYYSNEPSVSLKRLETERTLDQTIVSPLDCTYNQSELYSRKYDSLSPKNYSYGKSTADYDKHESYKHDDDNHEIGSYLSLKRKNSHSLSPNYQYDDHEFGFSMNPYSSELTTNLDEASKRPISRPEFAETIGQVVKYQENSLRDAMNFRKASLSLGPLDSTTSRISGGVDNTPSPRSMFSPFPIRNTSRKPKELGLKLGLYSPSNPGSTTLKRS